MNLPNNWDSVEAKELGEFNAPRAGGYICKVLDARDTISKSGRAMLVIEYDICEGEFKDYYYEKFAKDSRQDKKWKANFYQLYDGSSLPFFKGMISSIEKSNQGFIFQGNEIDLKGKVFGGVFGEEEFLKYDGTLGATVRLKYILSTERIRTGDFKVPSVVTAKSSEQSNSYNNTFASFSTSADDEDLPF